MIVYWGSSEFTYELDYTTCKIDALQQYTLIKAEYIFDEIFLQPILSQDSLVVTGGASTCGTIISEIQFGTDPLPDYYGSSGTTLLI